MSGRLSTVGAWLGRGTLLTLRYREHGDESVLWQGVVSRDASVPRISGGVATHEVECAGPQALLATRDDYCRTWVDDDLTAWQQSPSASQDYDIDTDGRLAIVARKGQPYRGGRACSVYYWLDAGHGPSGDSIDHLEMRLAGYPDSSDYGMDIALSGVWRVRVQAADSPWGTRTTVREWAPPGQYAAGTTFRVPSSGSLPSHTRCLWLQVVPTDDVTPTADRYVCVDRLIVYRSPSATRIDEAMLDVVSGVALSTSSEAVGSARTDIVVRPFTTRAQAVEQLAALHSEPVHWRWLGDRAFDVSLYRDYSEAGYIVVDPTDPGVDVELEVDPEGAPQYCRALFISAGIVQGYAACVVAAGYEASVVVDARSRPVTPAETDRVAVLDLRDSGSAWYPPQAAAVAAQYLRWCGAAVVSGTVTVHGGVSIVDQAGDEVPLTAIVPGTWCLVEGATPSPALITQVEVEAGEPCLTLTLGTVRGEWSWRAPYPTARDAADMLAPAGKGRYHGRRS